PFTPPRPPPSTLFPYTTLFRSEALEPEHARVPQGAQLVRVAGHGAAPEPDVDERLVARDLLLGLERLDVHRRRDRVERHVDDRRDAAGGRGPRRGREALPLGASRLVDVHVRVDEPGDEHLVRCELDDARAVEPRTEGLDRPDHSPDDPDLAGLLAGRDEHALAAHDEVVLVRPTVGLRAHRASLV